MKQAPSKLQAKAARYFELYPNAKAFFVTTDGNVFKNDSLAKNHCNSSKNKMEYYEVTKPEEVGPENELSKMSREELNAYAVKKGMKQEQAESYPDEAALIKAVESFVEFIKMPRIALNKLAVDKGISLEKAEAYTTKGDVVIAIMELTQE